MNSASNHEKCRKFSVGYQFQEDVKSAPLLPVIEKYREQICEVFFAMPGMHSGRYPMGTRSGRSLEEVNKIFFADLEHLRSLGIPGVMLFNSSCLNMHEEKEVMKHVGQLLDQASLHIDIKGITIMSPPLAAGLKKMLPELNIRASINLQCGDISQFEQLEQAFDGFYLQREYNRDPEHIQRVRKWCDDHGKSLHLLVNSGCLYNCPFHFFHVNMTAHSNELQALPCAWDKTSPTCQTILSMPEFRQAALQGSWIRPEDLHHVEPYFDTIKLATRTSAQAADTVQAYCEGAWHGNIFALTEPNYVFVKEVASMPNDRFPDDWYEHTTHCGHHCEVCDYCRKVLEAAQK